MEKEDEVVGGTSIRNCRRVKEKEAFLLVHEEVEKEEDEKEDEVEKDNEEDDEEAKEGRDKSLSAIMDALDELDLAQ